MAGQPTKIGKYDVLREIGRGGMGKVFAAVDPTIGRMVAIKQVTAVVSDDPELLKRFYREAQSTGSLQHPNIVTLHDLGEQDGVPYLVMEYLEGESLEQIIQKRRPYTVAEKLNIIIQVCEGLGYAHQRQIVHRDIKPGNIVVLKDGAIKIVDFGIAQFGTERFTRTGQVVGSLYYMSPEQIQDADIDSRSDIYSSGIVLYEFLTGAVPFRGKDPASTLAKILHGTPLTVASSVLDYATELDEIVRRALAKDRNTRYTSMEDFSFDLRSLEEKLSQDVIANHFHAAEDSIEEKQWERAREQLRHVLKLDKQNRRANEMLREVQTQIHRQQIKEQVRQLRQRADEALGLRKWDDALAVLDQAIKLDGTNSELIRFRDSVYRSNSLLTDALRRAESAHNAGDLDGAKSAVEEALRVDPYDTTAKVLSAILTKELSERAKRRKVEELMADARKEVGLRHFTSALEMLRVAEGIDPSETEVQQLIRNATAGMEHERRRVALEKACADIDDLLNRDEYNAACTKADELLLNFPQDLGLLKLKGFAEKQREAWNRRQFLQAQVATARRLVDSGELLRAQETLNEALERYPNDSGAISLLGIVTDGIARKEAQKREAERQANERKRYIQSQLDAAAELLQKGRTGEALTRVRESLARYADSDELKQRASLLEDALASEEVQRKRAEDYALQKRAEIEKTIAESWQLLSTKQTGQAVAMLGEAVRRYPDSADLKSQLEFAQRRLAVAKAELERAEQEARRRKSEIEKEVATAKRLLEVQETEQAVAELEKAAARFPDSEEIQAALAYSRLRLADEQARERAKEVERRRRAWVDAEISSARQLLDESQAERAVTSLQKALSQYPNDTELQTQFGVAKRLWATEQAERRRKESEAKQRRAEIEREVATARRLLDDKKVSEALAILERAIQRFPENTDLQSYLELAKNRFAREEAETRRIAEEARRMQEESQAEVAAAQQLLESGKAAQALERLEAVILRFPHSEALKSQLGLTKERVAADEAATLRVEQEKRRRESAIANAIASARTFLASHQTARAIDALNRSLRDHPDSETLSRELEAARSRLAAEQAERELAEREALRRRAEIDKEIAVARRLLASEQTGEAAAVLRASVQNFPESVELQELLTSTQQRLAREREEKLRAEQERQRRQSEISAQIAAARDWLESKQTTKAVTALQDARRKYPENEELHSLLSTAQEALRHERIAQEKAEREAHERSEKISAAVEYAKRLLKAKETSKALVAIEEALAQYPDSEDLRSLLAAAKERQSRENAERERVAKKEEQFKAERAKVRSLLDSGDSEKALMVAEAALRSLGKDGPLQELIKITKTAIQRQRAEEKKRAAELQQVKEHQRQRSRDLEELQNLARPLAADTSQSTRLELLGRAREVGARYPDDREIQQCFAEAHAVLLTSVEEAAVEASETRRATQLFAPRSGDVAPDASVPTQPTDHKTTIRPHPGAFPKFLNKWTVIAAVGVIVLGGSLKHFLSKPTKVPIFTVNFQTTPPGATIEVNDQTCNTPCSLTLAAGQYQVEARLQGFHPVSQDFTVGASAPSSPVKLMLQPDTRPESGFLFVRAGVEGADLLINGKKYSQITSDGTVRLPLEPGSYTVEVQKNGYQTAKSRQVQISKGQTVPLEFKLFPLLTESQLVITAAPPNAQVLADAHYLGLTGSDGSFSQSLEPGKHDITLIQDGRKSNAIREKFVGGQTVKVDGTRFTISPVPNKMTVVLVTSLPIGATVKVEGTSYSADTSGNARFDVLAGDHTIEIVAEGYKDKKIQQTFPVGQVTLVGALEPLDRETPEWSKVNQNDMGSLQVFLNKFPSGSRAKQAQSQLDQLVSGTSSESELSAFSNRFPNTAAGIAASKRLATLRAETARKDADSNAIRSLLDQYRSAYEQRDLNTLVKLYPNWSVAAQKATQSKFKNARSVTITLAADALSLNGDQASIKVTQTLNWTQRDGSQSSEMTPQLTWQLTRKDGRWVVQKGP